MKLFKVVFLCILALSLNAKEVVFTDVVGNEIKLNLPVKKVAIGFYYTDYLAVGGTKGFDKVVGFSKTVWKDWTPVAWKNYLKAMPKLDKIEDFGEASSGTMSLEKIIKLEPDVLILSKMQYNTVKDSLTPLKKANIPVVAVDFHEGSLKNHKTSTKIFGIISGEEQRAKDIINEYEARVKNIQEKTKNIKNKVKMYVEYGHGNKSINEFGLTYSHFMWGALIDKANGINISDGIVRNYGPSNPENVIVKNPDVIFIVGSDYRVEGNQAMLMGNGVTFNDANQRIKPYLKRTGWSDLSAVKNGQIFSGDHAMLRTLCDVFMLEFVAKAAYPELFKDLNPEQNYIDFYKKYMPITPNGVFMMKMDDEKF